MANTNTTRETAPGAACTDCIMLIANGETPPNMDEAETAEFLARVTDGEVTLGMMFGEGDCLHSDDDWEGHEECERLGFSWSPCDVCGTKLGGDREAVTFWL